MLRIIYLVSYYHTFTTGTRFYAGIFYFISASCGRKRIFSTYRLFSMFVDRSWWYPLILDVLNVWDFLLISRNVWFLLQIGFAYCFSIFFLLSINVSLGQHNYFIYTFHVSLLLSADALLLSTLYFSHSFSLSFPLSLFFRFSSIFPFSMHFLYYYFYSAQWKPCLIKSRKCFSSLLFDTLKNWLWT